MRAMRRQPGWTRKIAGLSLAPALVLAFGGAWTGSAQTGSAWAAEAASAPAASPQDTIRGFYAVLLTTMKQGATLGEGGRYARLAPVVRQDFDLPFMTKLAVGPDWTNLTASQQEQVTTAFGRYVAATYADRFDSYSGEQLQVGDEQPFAGGYIVRTKIARSTGDPATINYLLRNDAGSWQIADVYLDGTISQLATQRSEFHSILQREGVDGLIDALNKKVDLLKQSADNSP
jgi:phospholipid transport system substrate-binding protein